MQSRSKSTVHHMRRGPGTHGSGLLEQNAFPCVAASVFGMNDASGENVDHYVQTLEVPRKMPISIGKDGAASNPSRWWLASSAFPMIAGTLGPVASAFSICALVRPWRQVYRPGDSIQNAPYMADPKWLIAINACQLAVAIMSNLCLLLNMTRRLRFSIAQPLTIVGWYVSSFTLMALTGTAGGSLAQEHDTFVWSQAFYYGIYSAILYFVVASLMVATFYGAYQGPYKKDFVLTASQRTLMLQTITFLLYLLLGSLIFSTIEGWYYLDAVYWADVTLFTVGFGDLYPQRPLGRALLFPYALVGIVSLGLVIGSIRSMILDRGRRRIDARIVERRRRQMLRRTIKKGKNEILTPVNASERAVAASSSYANELDRRHAEFALMRRIQRQASTWRRWMSMSISTGTVVLLWLAGAKMFQECEKNWQGWSYFDGVYFCFVSLTTVGYGDVTPVSNAGKSFFVFWSLMALPAMTVLISNAGDTVVKAIKNVTNDLGTITILPGDKGFRKNFQKVAHSMSCGLFFDDPDDDVDEAAPGFLGDARRRSDSSDDDDEEGTSMARDEQQPPPRNKLIRFGDVAKPPKKLAAPNTNHQTLPTTRAVFVSRRTLPDLPTRKCDYHVRLVEEIGRVTKHLRSHPSRNYTFQEWSWYLKLIGEDEADAERHRMANLRKRGRRGKRHFHHQHKDNEEDHNENSDRNSQNVTPVEKDGRPCKQAKEREHVHPQEPWSWVGVRSPLMSSQEEAEWILDKLTSKLRSELEKRAKIGVDEWMVDE